VVVVVAVVVLLAGFVAVWFRFYRKKSSVDSFSVPVPGKEEGGANFLVVHGPGTTVQSQCDGQLVPGKDDGQLL